MFDQLLKNMSKDEYLSYNIILLLWLRTSCSKKSLNRYACTYNKPKNMYNCFNIHES